MPLATVSISDLLPGVNDRTVFEPQALDALAYSIRDDGLLQPITVRPAPDQKFTIIAGERRYRACKQLGWVSIAANVIEVDDEQADAMMLLENVARADLDPLDEAAAYQRRMERYSWSIEDCALRAGVAPSRVQSRLKLLSLRTDIKHLVRSGNMKLGYAQILADADLDANFQMIAIGKFRDNASATPFWFRRIVNDLSEKQRQQSMWDNSLFAERPTETPDPEPAQLPIPGEHTPPGATLQEHIAFWRQAAQEWAKLGKVFKQQQCTAAANALESFLNKQED